MDLREEPVTKLNQTSNPLTIFYLLLHLQVSVVLTPHQGNFSLQQMETITESYNQPKCSRGALPLVGHLQHTRFLNLGLWDHCGRGRGKIVRAREMDFAVRLCLLEMPEMLPIKPHQHGWI